ncbi:SPOR domain-containing protein [Dongia deserti]|uniref:SPOR domain-containing protein n=1 Tax=Dongia deserti TaxID=2268030 RepID=UPI0013C40A3F|nr:SPOR domain-containing protein [Dongia deserti]
MAAVIIVAAIGAWLWTGSTPSTEVPVITAEATPEKVKPAEEGGLQVQNQDVQVLDPSAKTQGETVMPEPEQPITPPGPSADQAPTVVENGQASPGTAAEAPTGDTQPAPGVPLVETPLPAMEENGSTTAAKEPAPAAPAAPVVSAPEPAQPEPTQSAEAPATTQSEPAQSTAGPTAAQAAQPDPSATQAAPTQEAAATPSTSAPSAATGNTRVQLAAGKSEASVEQEWAALQKAHPQLLGDLSLTVERVDKGAAGIFYRMQAGPLADKTAARQLCASLKQRGQDCIVVAK